MAPLIVRQAKPKDARAIAEIHVAAWRAAYRDILPQSVLDALSVEQRYAFWRGELSKHGPMKVAVTEDAQGLTGFCSYGPTRDDDREATAEIYAIYIQPGKWGQGAGRALFTLAFRAAAVRACNAMTAWVFRDNQAARSFYERIGFESDGATRVDAKRTGAPLQEMRYRMAFT